MKDICDYIEHAVTEGRQEVVLKYYVWTGLITFHSKSKSVMKCYTDRKRALANTVTTGHVITSFATVSF